MSYFIYGKGLCSSLKQHPTEIALLMELENMLVSVSSSTLQPELTPVSFPLFSHSKSATFSWLSCPIAPTSWIFTKMKKYPKNPKAASFWIPVQVCCRWVGIPFPSWVFFFLNQRVCLSSSLLFIPEIFMEYLRWARNYLTPRGSVENKETLIPAFTKPTFSKGRKTENRQRKK